MQKAYGKEINHSRVSDIKEISGHGIIAKVDGHEVAVGNSKLMKQIGVEYYDCHRVEQSFTWRLMENMLGIS